MQLVTLFAVVYATFTLVMAESSDRPQWMIQVVEHPEHPGQCLDRVTGTYHALGTKWKRVQQCEELTCKLAGRPGVMIIEGDLCPGPRTSTPTRGCHMTGYTAGDYPACCPRERCVTSSHSHRTQHK